MRPPEHPDWEKVATWLLRIVLLPPTVFLGWKTVPNLVAAWADPLNTNVLGTATEAAIVGLLFSAIFSPSPPWRNDALRAVLTWLLSFAALLLNLYVGFALASLLVAGLAEFFLTIWIRFVLNRRTFAIDAGTT